MSRTITGQCKAWITDLSHLTPEQLINLNDPSELLFTDVDMKDSGWTHVGEATIAVEIFATTEDLIASKVDTLKAQADKIRAEAHREVTRIESQINQLLAITHQPTEVA